MSEFEKLNKLSAPPASALAGTMRMFADAAGIIKTINEAGVVAAVGAGGGASLAQQAWVSIGGDDGTAVVGDSTKPFATLAAAEAAITDASISKVYVLNIGPGTFDFTGTAKKGFISWTGLGSQTTFINATGPINLASPEFAVPSSDTHFNFTSICFLADVSIDAVAAGLSAGSGAQYWVANCQFQAAVTALGLGGESVILFLQSCYLSAFTITSVSCFWVGSYGGGAVSITGDGSAGAQLLALGSTIISTVNVFSTTGGFAVFGCVGGFAGGGISADGSNAQLDLDSGTNSDPTLTNGATVTWLGHTSASAPHGVMVYSGNNTFNVPAGVTKVDVLLIGGGGGTGGSGGGGGGTNAAGGSAGQPGSSGGVGNWTTYRRIPVIPTDAITVIVGTGGTPGAGGTGGVANADGLPGSDGSAGGNSSFGDFVTLGGPPGSGGSNGTAGGGSGATGTTNTPTIQPGEAGVITLPGSAGTGGAGGAGGLGGDGSSNALPPNAFLLFNSISDVTLPEGVPFQIPDMPSGAVGGDGSVGGAGSDGQNGTDGPAPITLNGTGSSGTSGTGGAGGGGGLTPGKGGDGGLGGTGADGQVIVIW